MSSLKLRERGGANPREERLCLSSLFLSCLRAPLSVKTQVYEQRVALFLPLRRSGVVRPATCAVVNPGSQIILTRIDCVAGQRGVLRYIKQMNILSKNQADEHIIQEKRR